MGKAGLYYRTLIEIRFQANKNLKTLKMVEYIPKTTAAESAEIYLTAGGVFAEKDPIIIFTFNEARTENVLTIKYVISKKITTVDTFTFPAEETAQETTETRKALCGDGSCVQGESYMSCCTDCGCPQEFVCENNNCAPKEKNKCFKDNDCDDKLNSTKDSCTGKPKECQNIPITECISWDNYCPQSCTYENDAECPTPEQIINASIEAKENMTLNITGEQQPPEIVQITITPEQAKIGETIIIEAKVVDPNGKDDIERVWMDILELAQSHGETADMNDLGIEGDKAKNDDTYTTVRKISEYYLQGGYHVNVYAQDSAGNKKKQQKIFRVIGNQTG